MADTLNRAAAMLDIYAASLRECHNVDPENPTWEDEEEAREEFDQLQTAAIELRTLRDKLQVALDAEKERADYAWRNTRTIEAARQEEMAKRDKLTAALVRAEDFISGFEGDEMQEGIDQLLAEIRAELP